VNYVVTQASQIKQVAVPDYGQEGFHTEQSGCLALIFYFSVPAKPTQPLAGLFQQLPSTVPIPACPADKQQQEHCKGH
jgi:hypothetical protein